MHEESVLRRGELLAIDDPLRAQGRLDTGLLFEALNFKYVGPVQGHRLDVLVETFDNVKQMIANGGGPILVHAITAKGYGYEPAERDPRT